MCTAERPVPSFIARRGLTGLASASTAGALLVAVLASGHTSVAQACQALAGTGTAALSRRPPQEGRASTSVATEPRTTTWRPCTATTGVASCVSRRAAPAQPASRFSNDAVREPACKANSPSDYKARCYETPKTPVGQTYGLVPGPSAAAALSLRYVEPSTA